jgi:hypothetical protein
MAMNASLKLLTSLLWLLRDLLNQELGKPWKGFNEKYKKQGGWYGRTSELQGMWQRSFPNSDGLPALRVWPNFSSECYQSIQCLSIYT